MANRLLTDCPSCGASHGFDSIANGQVAKCPSCKYEFVLPEVGKPQYADFELSKNMVDSYDAAVAAWFKKSSEDDAGRFGAIGFYFGAGLGAYWAFSANLFQEGIGNAIAIIVFCALFGAMGGNIVGRLSSALERKPAKPIEPSGLQRFKAAEESYRIALANASKKLEQHRQEIAQREYLERRKLADFWLRLSGYEFESEMKKLFEAEGFRTTHTKLSGDGGVDLRLELDGKKYVVQCKAQKNPVGPSVVRDLFGVMNHENCDGGIVATTSTFTKGARDFAHMKKIKLVDLDYIVDKAKTQSKLNAREP